MRYLMKTYKQIAWIKDRRKVIETVKIEDVLHFLNSTQFLNWLKSSGDKSSKLNFTITNKQAYEIYFNSATKGLKEGKIFFSNIEFKNFKKLWGNLILFEESEE